MSARDAETLLAVPACVLESARSLWASVRVPIVVILCELNWVITTEIDTAGVHWSHRRTGSGALMFGDAVLHATVASPAWYAEQAA